MGDPTGIGPEVIAKAFRSDPLAKGKTHYLVIGDKIAIISQILSLQKI